MINPKVLAGALIILFIVILGKGFFALNNTFDISNPQDDPYEVDSSINAGIDDITGSEIDSGFFGGFFDNIDTEVWYAVLFLIIIGGFVIFLGQ